MELEKIQNLENVKKHRQDICKALSIEFSDDMLIDDYFLGRFLGRHRDYLDSLGLVNRGFCPLCGDQPVGNEYYRGYVHSKVVEYLCEECYKNTNPHLINPGYTRRYYTAKIVIWLVYIGLLLGAFFLIRGCFRFLF